MPRGLDVSLPEELQPAVLEPAMIVDWLAREEGLDMEDGIPDEEKKYMINKATTLRYIEYKNKQNRLSNSKFLLL